MCKYFGCGKGVVVYMLLCNYILFNGYLIGVYDYEVYYVFDIWYCNMLDIMLIVIIGDMYSVNKVNFVILYWFGWWFELCFIDFNV